MKFYDSIIRKYNLPSNEEDREIVERIKNKNISLEEVYKKYIGIVEMVSFRGRDKLDYEDILQQTSLNLWLAIKSYDPNRSSDIKSHLFFHTRNLLKTYFLSTSVIKENTRKRRKYLWSKNKKNLSEADRALFTTKVIFYEDMYISYKDLDADDMRLKIDPLDYLLAKRNVYCNTDLDLEKFNVINMESINNIFNNYFNNKPEIYSEILNERLLKDDDEGVTFATIASKYSLSRERVRQIQEKILKDLKKEIQEEYDF